MPVSAFKKYVVCVLLSHATCVSAAYLPMRDSPGRWVLTASVGPAWEAGGQTQTLFLQPTIEKTYAANQYTNALLAGELFIGRQYTLSTLWQGQWGINFGSSTDARLSGDIWDDGDAAFNNYTYAYQIQHNHVALQAKLLSRQDYLGLQAFINGGLGLGFNRAHHYESTPSIDEAVATPGFAAHTATSFAYIVGAGFQHALTAHLFCGFTYEFANWGTSHLGNAAGQTIGHGISLNHLYTNGLLFSVSYLQ